MKIIKYAKLYIEFLKQNIKAILEYRADFIVGFLSTLMIQTSGLLFVWIIFQNISNIKGWSFYEVTMVYGMLGLSKALFGLFLGNLWDFGSSIRMGDFDRILLRPMPPLLHLAANKIHHNNLGEAVVALVVMITSLLKLKIYLGPTDIFLMLLFIISGTLIFSSIILITATLSFWMVNSKPLTWAVYTVSNFAQFPLIIFSKVVAVGLTWVLPYAFVSYYPATHFLNKGYGGISLLSPVIALGLWIISLAFWKFGLKSYTSTGS